MDAEILRLQKTGHELYRAQQYEEALAHFNRIIHEYDDAPVEIFDHRAAAYAKLGDFRRALRDGEHIMRSEKCKAIGYLRTGQILQKMSNVEKALRIYQYGIHKVPVGASEAGHLSSMYDKLAARCASNRRIDPLAILPLDLVLLVLGQLEFHQLVYDEPLDRRDRAYDFQYLATRFEAMAKGANLLTTALATPRLVSGKSPDPHVFGPNVHQSLSWPDGTSFARP